MLVIRIISQVQIGGNASDNPVPFSDANFDFDAATAILPKRNINVIVYHRNRHAFLEVTGKVLLDSSGNPLIGQNDVVFLPCPPFCTNSD